MPSLAKGYHEELDRVLSEAVRSVEGFPGVVVKARRGECVYEGSVGLEKDSLFRMYSMTKVLTSTVALILHEKHSDFRLDDPVSKYIPSFARKWEVVEESSSADAREVQCTAFASGVVTTVRYATRPANSTMLVKHLMCECSGIGYDFWSDVNPEVGKSYAIASALRQQHDPTIYSSASIVGQGVDLERFCDILAEAGVLVCDPGVFSYGLGATVLGRVIEVVSRKSLAAAFDEYLLGPLGMSSACFFLDGPTPRLPPLHGVNASGAVVQAEDSVPGKYTNGTDHFAGPRKYFSGDTGLLVTVEDYSKFCDFILSKGVTPDGKRLLSVAAVEAMCSRPLSGMDFTGGLAQLLGMGHETKVMAFGWGQTVPSSAVAGSIEPHVHPMENFWGGYAGTQVKVYPTEDSYVVIGVQCMDHHMTGTVDRVLRIPFLRAFLSLWR
eukprot:Sspe_Gene.20850::Locus_7695_Transcript_1_1_Confidence_1.000_Length_2172::g.20850::m.20850